MIQSFGKEARKLIYMNAFQKNYKKTQKGRLNILNKETRGIPNVISL